ncbi:thioredoxin-like [Erpetoichthys calabaricus]|uniref:Thioredoxin n=1 Tax=Erpetoichthys calabaricus TaxID=27687 RepID=A0A8C4S7X2_ERPCA|nr:thioredoxin-like [Erpetoichthys calabaricus]
MVREIKNMTEFQNELKNATDKLVVIDFSATWCGPCRQIAPFYDSLPGQYPDVVFLKVDVDEAEDVAQNCEISAMPTFVFFRNGSKVDSFSGANSENLVKYIVKHKTQ